MVPEKRKDCIYRSKETRRKADTTTGIEAQRIDGGRISSTNNDISELYRKNTNRVRGKETAGKTFPGVTASLSIVRCALKPVSLV